MPAEHSLAACSWMAPRSHVQVFQAACFHRVTSVQRSFRGSTLTVPVGLGYSPAPRRRQWSGTHRTMTPGDVPVMIPS